MKVRQVGKLRSKYYRKFKIHKTVLDIEHVTQKVFNKCKNNIYHIKVIKYKIKGKNNSFNFSCLSGTKFYHFLIVALERTQI